MKNVFMLTVAALLSVMLSGCGKDKVKTEGYYLKHDTERTEKLAWCKDSADREMTPNCQNAHSASEKLKLDSMIN